MSQPSQTKPILKDDFICSQICKQKMALRFGLCVNDYEAMAEYYRIMCDDETHQPIVVRKQLHDYVHTRVYVPDGCPYMLEQIASNYVKQQETVSGRCKLWLERLYAKI